MLVARAKLQDWRSLSKRATSASHRHTETDDCSSVPSLAARRESSDMRPAKSNTVALLSLAHPRWPIAFRAALSLGIPLLLSWLINGDLSAGLVATLGSFTSLYASDRPYRNRALVLAGIAITFAAAVTAGVAVQGLPHAAVPLVVGIAMLASFFSASLKIGPPGAYMIVLACAAATAMPVTSLPLSHVFLLI